MCENCGVNHETYQVEDQDALDDFIGRLFASDNTITDDDTTGDGGDLFALLAEMFGEPKVSSALAEHNLTAEFELTGEMYGEPWSVKVAQVPVDQITEEARGHGSQWWALDGYYNGDLVRSDVGAPPEPVTPKEAAEAYAEYHFNYEISA